VIEHLVQWVQDLFASGWHWLVSQINVPVPPAWMESGVEAIDQLMYWGAQLAAWVPWQVAVAACMTVVGCIVAALTIRVLRIIASFVTGGGGS
jgi:hypothetical protein